MFEMIWTATSVLPVPGGPTMTVRPGRLPALMASTTHQYALCGVSLGRRGTLCGSEGDVVDADFIGGVGSSVGEGISVNFVDLFFFFLCIVQFCAFLCFPFCK
jgi:hypothetical protein